eukprot:2171325-Amphidinium_carterae.1
MSEVTRGMSQWMCNRVCTNRFIAGPSSLPHGCVLCVDYETSKSPWEHAATNGFKHLNKRYLQKAWDDAELADRPESVASLVEGLVRHALPDSEHLWQQCCAARSGSTDETMKEETSLFHTDAKAAEAAQECLHETDKKDIDMVVALGLKLKPKEKSEQSGQSIEPPSGAAG